MSCLLVQKYESNVNMLLQRCYNTVTDGNEAE